jgi:hypothetical protein
LQSINLEDIKDYSPSKKNKDPMTPTHLTPKKNALIENIKNERRASLNSGVGSSLCDSEIEDDSDHGFEG